MKIHEGQGPLLQQANKGINKKGEKESVNLPIDASIISSPYVNKLDAYTMAACC